MQSIASREKMSKPASVSSNTNAQPSPHQSEQYFDFPNSTTNNERSIAQQVFEESMQRVKEAEQAQSASTTQGQPSSMGTSRLEYYEAIHRIQIGVNRLITLATDRDKLEKWSNVTFTKF